MSASNGRSFFASALLLIVAAQSQAQLRVATWNITNYSSGRVDAFRSVLFDSYQGRSFNPDVLVVQEIAGSSSSARTTAVNNFLAMLNGAAGQTNAWAVSHVYNSSSDTGAAVFYKKDKVNFGSTTYVAGDPRDVARHDFSLKGYQAGSTVAPDVSFYNAHMKSGSNSDDLARRQLEAYNIRANAASLPSSRHVLIGGDFNMQSSSQAAYQNLVGATATLSGQPNVTGGRFYDPINTPGSWNNNNSFRFVHTQDPWGQGGMDDRLDFLLMGNSLRDGKGFEYIGNSSVAYSTTTWNDPNHSYRVWGNDGTSFNGPIRVGSGSSQNGMVGAVIAQAIRDSVGISPTSFDANGNPNLTGGHLPVFMDLKLPADIGLSTLSLNFGSILQNTSASQSLTVTNAVDAALWGVNGVQQLNYSYSLIGSGFSAPTGSFNLTAGSSLAQFITMDTSTIGNKSATLRITDSATGVFRDVALAGTVAVPEPGTMIALGVGALALLKRRRK